MDRLLIVEDEAGIRETLADFLHSREFHTVAVRTVADARSKLSKETFSVILLDLSLPDGDGLDVLRELRRSGTTTPVIILTARGSEVHRIRGLELGADDYVVKPFSVYELVARIRAVLRRSSSPSPSAIRIGDAEIDLNAFHVVRGGETFKLAQKEAELLAFLLRAPGKAFRREDLLRSVWGYDSTPTTRTVDTHVFNLRKKIEPVPDEPRHLMTVHGVGYKLVP